MATLKDALCLLAIFLVYGIVGQMDYEDAMAAQEIQQVSSPLGHHECLTAALSLDLERSSPIEWPDESSDWQSAARERCPHDSGGENAQP